MSGLSQPEIDLDVMMREIRAEVARRRASAGGGSAEPVGPIADAANRTASIARGTGIDIVLPRMPEATDRIETKHSYALADFLRFHDEAFVRNAYLGILRRAPDGTGLAGFLEALREGRLAKTEVLGRLRYSREGRAIRASVRGLPFAFAVRTLRKIPIIGHVVGTLQIVLRLPQLVRNHERLEADVFHRELRLNRHINALVTQIEATVVALAQHADALGEQQTFAQRAVSQLGEQLSVAMARIEADKADRGETERSLAFSQQALAQLTERVSASIARIETGEADRVELSRALASLELRKSDRDHVDNLLDEIAVGTRDLREAMASSQQIVQVQLGDIEHRVRAEIAASNKRSLAGLDRHEEELRRITSLIAGLETGLQDHERSLLQFQSSSSDRNVALEKELGGRERRMESFYVDFENRFRGSMEDIRSRLSVYVPVVAAAGFGTRDAPVVDLGSGRGEWLQLLRDLGLAARGVDANGAMVAMCHARGLEVAEADAAIYLQSQEPSSVGCVTAFHLVEHVSFETLLSLFDEALRVLRPGGLLILETPNPENLIVGACNFYVDPTHRRPLPPTMLTFIAESRGFERTEVRRLHPSTSVPPGAVGAPALPEGIEVLLFGPQDYALLAYKPK